MECNQFRDHDSILHPIQCGAFSGGPTYFGYRESELYNVVMQTQIKKNIAHLLLYYNSVSCCNIIIIIFFRRIKSIDICLKYICVCLNIKLAAQS